MPNDAQAEDRSPVKNQNRIWLGGDQAFTVGHFRSLSSTLWLMGVRDVGPLAEDVFANITSNFYPDFPAGETELEMLGVRWWKKGAAS